MKRFFISVSRSISIALFILLLNSATFAQWQPLDGPTKQAGGYSSDIGVIDNRAFILDDCDPDWGIVYGLYEITNNGKKLSRVDNVGTFETASSFAADDQTIFIGITGGILISSDKGNTWEAYHYALFGSASVAAYLVKGDTLIVKSVDHFFRSYDKGITWKQISGKSTQNNNGSYMELVGQNLFMMGYHNLFKSSDWGDNWVSVGSSWPSLLNLLYDGSRFYVLSESGLYISYDQGQTFTFYDTGFLWLNTITKKGNYLLIGTSLDDRIYRSDDNGLNWIGLPNSLIDNYVLDLASTSNIVFAGLYDGYVYSLDNGENWNIVQSTPVPANKILKIDSQIYAGTNNGLFCFSPVDSIWKLINKEIEYNGTNDFVVENTLIYTANEAGVYKSDNHGQSWNLLGLTNNSPKTLAKYNNDLLVGTNRDGVFYTGTDGQLWVSRNNGLPTNDEYGNYNPLISSFINNSFALVGFAGDGLFRSENKGVTWEKCNGIDNDTVRTIIQATNEYYAGTHTGVYVSDDNGINWIKMPDPSLSSDVSDLFHNGVNLFVSLRKGGVYIWDKNKNSWLNLNSGIPSLNVISITGDSTDLVISTFSKGINTRGIKDYLGNELLPLTESNIYPNPCQSTLCIKTKSPFTNVPNISIKTIDGRTVVCKITGIQNGIIFMDVSHLLPGIYMLTLASGKNNETYKFVKTNE